jgi:outer membrane protein assembly factor BamB
MNAMKIFHLPLLLLATTLFTTTLHAEDNWQRFRGPTGRGHTTDKDVATEWSADSVKWKVDLKGIGQSSVVNVADKLFLTGASTDGSERYVFCLSRKDGSLLWEKTIASPVTETPHKMNSFATPTCATDGKRVIAFFGPAGIHAFDLDGKELWSHQLGDFPGPFGVAASPIIVDGKVIQNCDAEGPSPLIAFDIETGEKIWQTEREEKPKGGWSTPFLIETADGKTEMILNGEFGVRGYDPTTGKELWYCEGFNGRGSPTPDFDGETLYVVNGKPGDTYAVTPGGSGDVTKTHRKWHAERRGGRDLPSPAVVDGYVVIASMSGITSCYDAKTGEVYWAERLGDGIEIAGAPLVANGLVYFQVVYGGDTIVVRPGKKLDIVARNSIGAKGDEIFRASLVPIQGDLFVRSGSVLYCIGGK